MSMFHPDKRPIVDRIKTMRNSIDIHCPWIMKARNNGAVSPNKHEISSFSESSRRSLTFAIVNNPFPSSKCCQASMTFHERWPNDGVEAKALLHVFLVAFKRYAKKKQFPPHYLWLMEFQSRGAVHFHFFCDHRNVNNQGFRDWFAHTWNRITGEGFPHYDFHHHEKNFVSWELSSPYLLKYLSKHSQKQVPENYHSCGRFWGTSHGFTGESKVVRLVSPDDLLSMHSVGEPYLAKGQKKNIAMMVRAIRNLYKNRFRKAVGASIAEKISRKVNCYSSKRINHFTEDMLNRLIDFFHVLTWDRGLYQMVY